MWPANVPASSLGLSEIFMVNSLFLGGRMKLRGHHLVSNCSIPGGCVIFAKEIWNLVWKPTEHTSKTRWLNGAAESFFPWLIHSFIPCASTLVKFCLHWLDWTCLGIFLLPLGPCAGCVCWSSRFLTKGATHPGPGNKNVSFVNPGQLRL